MRLTTILATGGLAAISACAPTSDLDRTMPEYETSVLLDSGTWKSTTNDPKKSGIVEIYDIDHDKSPDLFVYFGLPCSPDHLNEKILLAIHDLNAEKYYVTVDGDRTAEFVIDDPVGKGINMVRYLPYCGDS